MYIRQTRSIRPQRVIIEFVTEVVLTPLPSILTEVGVDVEEWNEVQVYPPTSLYTLLGVNGTTRTLSFCFPQTHLPYFFSLPSTKPRQQDQDKTRKVFSVA